MLAKTNAVRTRRVSESLLLCLAACLIQVLWFYLRRVVGVNVGHEHRRPCRKVFVVGLLYVYPVHLANQLGRLVLRASNCHFLGQCSGYFVSLRH